MSFADTIRPILLTIAAIALLITPAFAQDSWENQNSDQAPEGFGVDDDLDLEALLEQDISTLRSTTVAPAMDVEVSTVSRQESTIGRSPAAVFVISHVWHT